MLKPGILACSSLSKWLSTRSVCGRSADKQTGVELPTRGSIRVWSSGAHVSLEDVCIYELVLLRVLKMVAVLLQKLTLHLREPLLWIGRTTVSMDANSQLVSMDTVSMRVHGAEQEKGVWPTQQDALQVTYGLVKKGSPSPSSGSCRSALGAEERGKWISRSVSQCHIVLQASVAVGCVYIILYNNSEIIIV